LALVASALFQLHRPGAQGQDLLLEIGVLLTFVEYSFLDLLLSLAETAYLLIRGFPVGKDEDQLGLFLLLFLLCQYPEFHNFSSTDFNLISKNSQHRIKTE